MPHSRATSTRPSLLPSASTTLRVATASIRCFTAASGRLMFVTPPIGSTPLQPSSTVLTEIWSRMSVASGSTSECCNGRSVPPSTTTVIRGVAGSSSSAVFSPFVKTTTSLSSARAAIARAAAAAVVPTSTSTVSPSSSNAAAAWAIATFSAAKLEMLSSNGCSWRGINRGIAPPRTRCTLPLAARESRSPRTVTSETPKRLLSSPTRTNSRSLISASMRSRRSEAGTGGSVASALTRASPHPVA